MLRAVRHRVRSSALASWWCLACAAAACVVMAAAATSQPPHACSTSNDGDTPLLTSAASAFAAVGGKRAQLVRNPCRRRRLGNSEARYPRSRSACSPTRRRLPSHMASARENLASRDCQRVYAAAVAPGAAAAPGRCRAVETRCTTPPVARSLCSWFSGAARPAADGGSRETASSAHPTPPRLQAAGEATHRPPTPTPPLPARATERATRRQHHAGLHGDSLAGAEAAAALLNSPVVVALIVVVGSCVCVFRAARSFERGTIGAARAVDRGMVGLGEAVAGPAHAGVELWGGLSVFEKVWMLLVGRA